MRRLKIKNPVLLFWAILLFSAPLSLYSESARNWTQHHGFGVGVLSDWKWIEEELDDWMENLAGVSFGYQARSYVQESGWGFRADVLFLLPFALVEHYDGDRTTANRDRYSSWWGLYNFLGGSRNWEFRQGEVVVHVDAGLNHFIVLRSGRSFLGTFLNIDSSLGLALGVGMTQFLTDNVYIGYSLLSGAGIIRWDTWSSSVSERTSTDYMNSFHVMPSVTVGVKRR